MDNERLNEWIAEQSEQYISALFRDTSGYVEFRSLPSAQGKHIRSWKKPKEAIQHAPLLIQQGYDFQIGVLPRILGGGTLKYIAEFSTLYVDIDDDPAMGIVRLSNFALEPTLCIGSGRGIHAYWVLNPIIPKDDFRFWSKMQHAIVKRLSGDGSATDPTRLLRLPGSFNLKRGKYVEILFSSDVAYHPEVIMQFLGVTPSTVEDLKAAEFVSIRSKADTAVHNDLKELIARFKTETKWLSQKNILLLKRCPVCIATTGNSELWKSWVDALGNLRCWRSSCAAGGAQAPGGLPLAEWIEQAKAAKMYA